MALALILAIVTVFAALQLLSGVSATLRTRGIRQEVARQRCLAEFARAGSALFALVHRGELSPESNTFRTFHAIQAQALTPCVNVLELRDVLHETLFPSPRGELPWMREAASWPAGMRGVLRWLADGLGDLIMVQRGTFGLGGAGTLLHGPGEPGLLRSEARTAMRDLATARDSLRAWAASGTAELASVAAEYRHQAGD